MRKINYILILLFISFGVYAQNMDKLQHKANKLMRSANKSYANENYADAEVDYKKAIATLPNQPETEYNLANAMMQQKRYKEAIKHYEYLAKNSKSQSLKAKSYHNLGNAFMGISDFAKAVEAYKNSLRINPKDEETRYNLALAQEMLKNQQEQNQNNQNQNQQNQENKDQQDQQNQDNQNQENQNDQNQDKQDQNQDQNQDENEQDSEDKQDQSEDEKDNSQNQNEDQKEEESQENKDQKPDNQDTDQQKETQPQPGKISPQQLKQLLEAMQNEENKTLEKINAKKMKGKPVQSEKDW